MWSRIFHGLNGKLLDCWIMNDSKFVSIHRIWLKEHFIMYLIDWVLLLSSILIAGCRWCFVASNHELVSEICFSLFSFPIPVAFLPLLIGWSPSDVIKLTTDPDEHWKIETLHRQLTVQWTLVRIFYWDFCEFLVESRIYSKEMSHCLWVFCFQ